MKQADAYFFDLDRANPCHDPELECFGPSCAPLGNGFTRRAARRDHSSDWIARGPQSNCWRGASSRPSHLGIGYPMTRPDLACSLDRLAAGLDVIVRLHKSTRTA